MLLPLLCASIFVLAMSSTFPTMTTALPDSVETFDNEIATMPVSVFANGSVVFVVANDGGSSGGLTIANVTDETFGDYVLVNLYDDGTGGDNPNDGVYTGNFTVVYDMGVNGQFTDDITDTLDLMDGGVATVVVDIDLQMDPGLAQIQGDFSPPNVTINSGSDTVDLAYTLNATITDPNMDTSNVWYNVDGGTNRRLTFRGGTEYETQIDTSSLLDGPHTIGVVASDIVLNSDSTQTVTITVDHPAPDIDITVTHTPDEPKEGDRVTFTVEIENTGDADAEDISVSLIVDGTEVDTQTETIAAGGTSTVELEWTATDGQHDIEVQLSGTGVNMGSPLDFDIQPAPEDILENPWFLAGLVVIFTIALIGGTIIYARVARDIARGTAPKTTPTAYATTEPVGAKGPCEEIRSKWKTIQAEYERAKAERDAARQRADDLKDRARQAREEAEKAKQEAEEANQEAEENNKAYEEGKRALEDANQAKVDFFDDVLERGMSVGDPDMEQPNNIGFFGGEVKIWFWTAAQGNKLAEFKRENSETYDQLQQANDDLKKELEQLRSEAAKANREVADAEARAEEAETKAQQAESEAAQAEREYENLKNEAENLKNKAEAFREKWRICKLKSLEEATERAEKAAQDAAEAARRAKEANNPEDYEKAKEEAENARDRAGEAEEDAEGIKEDLDNEGMDADTGGLDERMRRARSDADSAVDEAVRTGGMFHPDPSNMGGPCKPGESRVLGESTHRFQFFDPTREIKMPHFYGTEGGTEAAKGFAQYLKVVSEICGKIQDAIEELPGGGLVGVPLEYWSSIMEAGGDALESVSDRPGRLG
ncbi:MAG: CARDB domain-containing protein, partial [Thermoplasmata archaeon]